MKKSLSLFIIFGITAGVFAQSPQKISYQAVIRNSSGALVVNHAVGLRVSILQGSATGTPVYVETQTTTTNVNGLATIEIGGGSIVTGTITGINWVAGPYYLKTETDPNGGTSYTIIGTSQLLSVPYALYAKASSEMDPTWNGAANQTGDIGRTGNVGIGTSTPIAKLEVTGGDALVNELTVGKGKGSQLANTVLGYSALYSNTTGIYNTAFGNASLYNNTEGESNTALGFRALFTNTDGDYNTATGMWALFSNSTGRSNTANGEAALYFNTTGYQNTAIGASALYGNKTGHLNTANGVGALDSNVAGYSNTAVGAMALGFSGDGNNNTAIGQGAGREIGVNLAGERNTFIGAMTGYEHGNISNSTAVGANVRLINSNTVILGNAAFVGIGTSVPAAGLHIKATNWPGSFIYLEGGLGQDAGMRLYEGATPKWHIYNNAAAGGLQITNNNANTAIFAKQANSFVGIATSNPEYTLDVAGTINIIKGFSGAALLCNGSQAIWYNGTYYSWGYQSNYNYFASNVTIGSPSAPGYNLVVNGTAAKTGGGSWSVLSDFRLKKLIGKYNRGLNEIKDLDPVIFTYKEGNPRELASDEEQIGFISQDVQKIFPEAVNECKDGYLDFNMHPVNVAMVNAIKELNQKIELQQKEIDELKRLVTDFMQK